MLDHPLMLLSNFLDVILQFLNFLLHFKTFVVNVIFALHNQRHVVFETVLVLFIVDLHLFLNFLQNFTLMLLIKKLREV